jgi:hypothetical protein
MRLQSDSNQVLGHVSIDCKDVSGCLDSIMVHLLGEGNSFSGNVFSAVDGKVCRRRVYAVNEPIHYLAFHDNCSLVILLHHAADGKVTLMLMHLHGHGSNQSIDLLKGSLVCICRCNCKLVPIDRNSEIMMC